MTGCEPVMLERTGHIPGHPETIAAKHAIAAAIMIVGASMQDVRGPGGKIQRMKQAALEADLLQLLARMNRGGKNTLIVPSEYLEVVVTKQ